MLILALDGGGIRGAFTARLIDRLAAAVPGFLDQVAMFAGTSTGGIIVLGLAAGVAPGAMVNLYLEHANEIFDASETRKFESLGGLMGPRYGNLGLRAALTGVFGTRTLGSLTREVMVTSYECVQHRPVDITRADYPNMDLVEAALRTSAAPTYFPPAGRYIDGGMTANNPALAALAWAISRGADLRETRILSIGTGNAAPAPLTPGDWGIIDWFRHGFVELCFSGPAERATADAQRILGERLFRLDGSVDCAMDETRDLERRLIAPADAMDLTRPIDWLAASGKGVSDAPLRG